MRKILLFCTFLLLLAMTETAKSNVFPYPYKVETLPNGLKVILVPMNSPGIVSYYTVVRTGSRDEWEPGRSGFAHFFEHMMFRGTKRHPGGVYDSIITSLGAEANAYTTDDYTCYHLTIANTDLERVMDLESDRFQFLQYPEPEFKTESGAVYGEFRKGRTSPFNVLWEKIKETAFDKHTYRHTTIGYEADIKNMPNMYDYSKSFYQRYYRPENCVIMVVGDMKEEATLAAIKKYYGSWAKGYTEPKIEQEPEQTAERTATVTYDGKTNPILAIGYKNFAFSPTNKQLIARDLFADLAFGSNSKLFKRLYLQEQKVISFQPSFQMNRDPFMGLIYTMTTEENLKYVQDEILKEIDSFSKNVVDATELQNLKKRIKYSYVMDLDSPKKVAGNLARFVAITGGIEKIEDYFATIESITPQDILEAAKSLTPEKRTIVILKGSN